MLLRHLVIVALAGSGLVAQQPATVVTAGTASEVIAPLPPLPTVHFHARRDAVRQHLQNGVLLLRGATRRADMGLFQQDQDFYYLTGVSEPGIALLVSAAVDELLVPPPTRFTAQWEGEFLAPGAPAATRTGFGTVANVRQLEDRLKELFAPGADGKRPVLWTQLQAAVPPTGTPGSAGGAADAQAGDPLDGRVSREQALKDKLLLMFPGLEVQDITPVLHKLRVLKAPEELAALRSSAATAAEGIAAAMRGARPGMYEFQLAATARYVFSLHGAGPDAYGAIVGAGKNGCVLHYMKNDQQLAPDDLIVMDYAPTVRGYAADVTRTFPASGRFSPAQRELVQNVYEIQQALLKDVKPGARLGELSKKCAELLLARGYRSDHGPCHHVGLAVHDPTEDVLAAGMVITVEPGAYLKDKGMGCRIEDTVLVTETGYEVLSAGVPSTPDAIEALMHGRAANVPVGLPR